MAADLAIMPHMRIGQKKIVVPDARDSAAFDRSPADGHILTVDIPVPGLQFYTFSAKGVVLGIAANYAKRVKNIPRAKF